MKTTRYKNNLKTILAIIPFSGSIYISWYVWQQIKASFLRLADWSISQTSEATTQLTERLKKQELLFLISLVVSTTWFYVFGEKNDLNFFAYIVARAFNNFYTLLINL